MDEEKDHNTETGTDPTTNAPDAAPLHTPPDLETNEEQYDEAEQIAREREFSKGDTAEIRRRVDIVFGYLTDGHTRAEIRHLLTDPNGPHRLDISVRTIARYIERANKQLEEMAVVIRDREFGKALARAEAMYRSALVDCRDQNGNPDVRTALAVERHRAELTGIYAPTKQQHSGETVVRVVRAQGKALTVDEQEAAADALRAATGTPDGPPGNPEGEEYQLA